MGECYEGRHYIGGEWLNDAPNGRSASLDPATGESLGEAPLGSAILAEQAILAARRAFETTGWSSDPRLRARVLLDLADRLEARIEEIAQLLTRENGKILADARHEVFAAVSEARYYAGLARNVFGRTFESGAGKMSLLTREPSGVVAVIVPWNAPVTLLVRSVAPALAAGCTVVIKPAPQTPLVNAEVMRAFDAVEELPQGVVNSVNENGTEVGDALSRHPEVDVISFTGSSRTGKIIMANAAATLKHLSLELGGKAPAVVFEDADGDGALKEIRRAATVLSGQMCTSVSRVLVAEEIAEDFTAQLKQVCATVKVGPGLDKGSEMGPMIDKANQARVLGIIERAADEAEAISKANATRYGLAASLYTTDLNRAMRLGRKLRFGTVWLNSHNRLMAEAETGGFGESGIGRLHGVEALNDFLQTKHIYYEAGG